LNFAYTDGKQEEYCLEIVGRIRDTIRSCVNMNAVFGISMTEDSGNAVKQLYEEALKVLDDAKSAGKEYCIFGASEHIRKEIGGALNYIDNHYCDLDISLSTAAREVGIHKDYLSKLFKREMGIGFSDYLNAKRIDRAKELLDQTSMKSYEIARTVGFQDECYFSRVFKKIIGMGPNEYKKQKREVVKNTGEK